MCVYTLYICVCIIFVCGCGCIAFRATAGGGSSPYKMHTHIHKKTNRDGVTMEDPWAIEPVTITTSSSGSTLSSPPSKSRTATTKTLTIDSPALEAAWEPPASNSSSSNGEWADWLRRVSVELVRQSPSPVIRPCAGLAQVHFMCCVSAICTCIYMCIFG